MPDQRHRRSGRHPPGSASGQPSPLWRGRIPGRLNAAAKRRRISTFSRDTGYSDSPTASRALAFSDRLTVERTLFPTRTATQRRPRETSTATPLALPRPYREGEREATRRSSISSAELRHEVSRPARTTSPPVSRPVTASRYHGAGQVSYRRPELRSAPFRRRAVDARRSRAGPAPRSPATSPAQYPRAGLAGARGRSAGSSLRSPRS